MKEHYNFNRRQMRQLKEKGIGISELYHLAINDFQAAEAPISKISLYYYVDKHGDFTELNKPSDHVAMAIFESLPIKEQIAIGEYMEHLEDEK